MHDMKCECGKIVCQIQNNTVVIKCRHCKRFLVIRINAPKPGNQDLTKSEYK